MPNSCLVTVPIVWWRLGISPMLGIHRTIIFSLSRVEDLLCHQEKSKVNRDGISCTSRLSRLAFLRPERIRVDESVKWGHPKTILFRGPVTIHDWPIYPKWLWLKRLWFEPKEIWTFFAIIQSVVFLDVCWWFATSATFLYRRWSLAWNLIWGNNLCIGLQWLGSKACKGSKSERTLVDCHGKVETGSGTACLSHIFKRNFTVLSVDSTGSDSIKNVARSNSFLRRSSSNTFKDLGTIGIAPSSPRKQCGKMTTGSCSLSSEHHCWM